MLIGGQYFHFSGPRRRPGREVMSASDERGESEERHAGALEVGVGKMGRGEKEGSASERTLDDKIIDALAVSTAPVKRDVGVVFESVGQRMCQYR